MLLRKFGIVAAGVTLIASLSACDFTAEGTLECRTAEDGKVVCTAQGTGTPAEPEPTPDPEPTDPPGSEEPTPDPEPEPEDPNDGLPAATVQAKQSGPDKVRVWWSTERTDVTGWYISRDGVDSSGYGTWGTELARDKTDVTFNLLNPGAAYTFTVVGHTADGDLPPVEATVEVAVVEPPVDPEPTDPTPTDPAATTAAEKFGWGAPIAAASDEFNYTGAPNAQKWATYNSPGHDGNGRRVHERNQVNGTALVQSGLTNGDSAGLASTFDQQYGRWEARVKTEALGADNGRQYHPLLIIWPESNQWPAHGEYDFFENSAPELDHIEAFLHYPGHTPIRQEHSRRDGVDTAEWQNIAFEWTPQHLKGFVNGEEWFHHDKHDITGMPSGHLTIQLDNFYGSNMQPANYYVDWVRTYSLQ